jgi:hypothetical protein
VYFILVGMSHGPPAGRLGDVRQAGARGGRGRGPQGRGRTAPRIPQLRPRQPRGQTRIRPLSPQHQESATD